MKARAPRRGFTLLEVVAAVAVIAILAAIGTASSRSVRDTVQDREAGASLERAVATQRAYAASNGQWGRPEDLPEGLGIQFTESVSEGPAQASTALGPNGSTGMAVLSSSGNCQAVVLADPILDGRATQVQIGPRSPCSGGGALASLP